MRGTRTRLVFVGILALLAAALSNGATANPAEVGAWSAPFCEPAGAAFGCLPTTAAQAKVLPTAVSIAVLPDGRLVYWNGLEGSEDATGTGGYTLEAGLHAKDSRARVLDLNLSEPSNSTWTSDLDPNETAGFDSPGSHGGRTGDMFCADQRLLANGKLVIAGGTWLFDDPLMAGDTLVAHGDELHGRDDVRLFDSATNTFIQAASMHHHRWYPTLLTLKSGKLLVASGVDQLIKSWGLQQQRATEIFDPANNTWTDNDASGERSLPAFARLHMLPNGKILYAGTGQMWSPFTESVDEALWNLQATYDPGSNTWETLGPALRGAKSGAFETMLMLKAPYDEAKILVGGGVLGVSPGTYLATNLSEIVTSKRTMGTYGPVDVITNQPGPDLNNARWFSSSVLLPTGEVLAFSGGDRDEVVAPGSEKAVRMAELYDPVSNTWRNLNAGGRDRTYHNSAILLRDGSVLVGGHSPIPNGYDRHMTTEGNANNFKDPSFEIYQPPYLFRGDRPTISGLVPDPARGAITINTPNAGAISSVVMIRLPSTTHGTDPDMRGLELTIAGREDGHVSALVPADRNVLPPGFYYLFIVRGTGQNAVPSVAEIWNVPAIPAP